MFFLRYAFVVALILGGMCLAVAFAYHDRAEDMVRQSGRDRYQMDTHPLYPRYSAYIKREALWGVPGMVLMFGGLFCLLVFSI